MIRRASVNTNLAPSYTQYFTILFRVFVYFVLYIRSLSSVCPEQCMPLAVYALSGVCHEQFMSLSVYALSSVCPQQCMPLAVYVLSSVCP